MEQKSQIQIINSYFQEYDVFFSGKFSLEVWNETGQKKKSPNSFLICSKRQIIIKKIFSFSKFILQVQAKDLKSNIKNKNRETKQRN